MPEAKALHGLLHHKRKRGGHDFQPYHAAPNPRRASPLCYSSRSGITITAVTSLNLSDNV